MHSKSKIFKIQPFYYSTRQDSMLSIGVVGDSAYATNVLDKESVGVAKVGVAKVGVTVLGLTMLGVAMEAMVVEVVEGMAMEDMAMEGMVAVVVVPDK